MDIWKLSLGNVVFFAGYFFVLITKWIIPALINPLANVLDSFGGSSGSTLASISYIGMLMLWVALLIIAPIGVKIYGLQKQEHYTALISTAVAIGYIIFWSAIFFAGSYAYSGMANALNDQTGSDGKDAYGNDFSFLPIMFWVGLMGIIIMDIIIVPIYLAMHRDEMGNIN